MKKHCLSIILLLLPLLCSQITYGRTAIKDSVIAVIGTDTIWKSDLEIQVAQARQRDPDFNDSMKYELLQQMLLQKTLIRQAREEGIRVGETELEDQLDNRLRYFTQMYGSTEKLEQVSGKTIYQLKEDNRQTIKDQILAERMENHILKDVKVSHAEVIVFFNKIPKDSLPVYPESVEIGQIVIDITTSLDVAPNDYETTLKRLGYIRERLAAGKYTFVKAVRKFSNDEDVKRTGAMLTDPVTGSTLLAVCSLDPSLVSLLNSMRTGDYSQPQLFNNAAGERSCRILYLKARMPAHKANLEDDYDRIREVALQQKKMRKFQDWFIESSIIMKP